MSYFPFQQTLITPEGGIAIRITNNTGVASVKGNLIEADGTLTGLNCDDCIGVIYEAGIANGNDMWVVVYGKAQVLLDDNTGSTVGNWVEASEPGYANAEAGSPAAAPQHFQEIGHSLQTVAAGGGGTHVLCLVNLHFL